MDFVTQEANIKLIKEIRVRPCLYNKNLPSYNRKSVQDKAWDDVGKCMGWQASQCKERWRNLRCVYLRHIKKMSRGVHKRPYYLMKAMSFALPFVKPLNCDPLPKEMIDVLQGDDGTEGAIYDEEEQTDTRKSFESQSSNRHMGSESPEPSQSFVTEFLPTNQIIQIKHEDDSQSSDLSPLGNDSQSQGRRMIASNELEVKIPDLSTNIDLKTDARKMFLYSLLPDVYAMSDAQMRQFKLKVLNVIGDILDSENV